MVSTDMFARRAHALEDEFFRRIDQELIRKLREREETERGRERLRQATGITETSVLSDILSAGVHAETLAALTLVPLVQVAWADRRVDADEREEVLEAAEAHGVRKGAPCYQILDDWLRHRPEAKLYSAWRNYIAELKKVLGPEDFQQLRDDVSRRARQVARETGGVLGIGSISDAEAAVLTSVAQAFDSGPGSD